MNFIAELVNEALNDTYLDEIFYKAEKIQAQQILKLPTEELTTKEFVDILRFSDLLSHSDNYIAQNKAYKIISLLIENYEKNEIFQSYANSVMIRLGNFPALALFSKKFNLELKQNYEVLFEKSVKEVYQKIPNSDLIFTDSQYNIFESLKNNNHFSFSGPTSLGKSFIFGAFIQFLIKEHRGTDNLAILVPSRALINQTVSKLKANFKNEKNYTILSHPTVPAIFRKENSRYIFVFTPERLVSYLSNTNNPKLDYLFVDEAHKIVAPKDTRSPLYYHAILQAERKSIKLYFASPNIKNPNVFLKIFEKSTDESITIKASPVAQNRYFFDLIEKKCLMFSDTDKEYNAPVDFSNNNFFFWLNEIGGTDKNIIYCNSKIDTINYALKFSRTRENKKSESLNEVINLVTEHLHEEYYLIDCLRKGIAFHFGNLPQLIREQIEKLFEDKEIDFLFCTSTLLEGVNLPAKNIFILANRIGLSKFTDIDFWNLAGRAGRMTKEMSGNIICMRVQENKWKDTSDLDVVKDKSIRSIEPLIEKGQGNFFKNIEASLTNTDFTNKKASQSQKDIWDYYGNLALLHEIKQDDSVLHSNFIAKNSNALKTLRDRKKEIIIPDNILSSSSMIKILYQNDIFMNYASKAITLPATFDYDIILEKLLNISELYNWKEEESGGKNPLYPSSDSLNYYATLMNNWMSSQPLKMIISNSIKYYQEKGEIFDEQKREYVNFTKTQKHINIVVNEVIYTIDNLLRFKIKNYFENYYNILKEKLGEDNAGSNWADFIEYGTTDSKVIELQNIGIPRHLAQYLLKNHSSFIEFKEETLISIDSEMISNELDKETFEYKEFIELFNLR